MSQSQPNRWKLPCETMGCGARAVAYLTCQGEDSYPYCQECADVLLRHGETMLGAVDDPLVAERDRLAEFARWAQAQFHVLDCDEGYRRASVALDGEPS